MKNLVWVSGVAISVFMAACVGSPPAGNEAPATIAGQPVGQACKKDTPVGSHIPRNNCETRDSLDQERDGVEGYAGEMRKHPMPQTDK
jgi:hypothetical protein